MQTVFHLITGDAEEQETALTIAENLTEDESVDVTDVTVVAQSEGIEPLRAEEDGSDTVRELIDQGIEFRACGNTLDVLDIADAGLVDGVETVPSGAGELTRLQDQGYSYIRP